MKEELKKDISKNIAINSPVFKGKRYRITVLSHSLVRLEYNIDGIFNDDLTELVDNRIFDEIDIEYQENDKTLIIDTAIFKLTYIKDKNFAQGKLNQSSVLNIELKGTDRSWYYNHPEARNIKAPVSSTSSSKIQLRNGLYSLDGFASLKDDTKLIKEDGKIEENKYIDIYVFMYGTDYERCLKDYFTLTGYPPLIPRYALGNWWSKSVKYNDETLKTLIDSFKLNGIPLSTLMLINNWNLKPIINNKEIDAGLSFNKEVYKHPKNMITYLHNQGVRIGLKIKPTSGFYATDEYYNEAVKYLQKDELGKIPFNVLDKRCVEVYLKLFIHPLENLGVDFFYIDKEETNNYNLIKRYHLKDMERNKLRRPFVFGYSNEVAPHKYSVLYEGEKEVGWESLRRLPYFNSLAVNNGVLWWSHDIGGYSNGIEEDELYTRFIQFGTFSPILRLSSDSSKYYKREPWLWSMRTFSIVKEYLQLRHKLIPYLYSEAYKYSTNGNLFIKPIFYKYPELIDDDWYRNEYYFGSQLFVSPIITKKDEVMNRVVHKFFIPDGTWYDFFTGKKFIGPNSFISFFRDQDYPVYAKQGAIIVLGQNNNLNDITPPKDLEIHIFPGMSNSYTLYEDDGVSSLYKDGYYLKTQIDYNYMPNNYTVILRALEGKSSIAPDTRNYKFIFRNTKQAQDVIVYANNMKIESNNYINGTDFIVEVKDANTIGQLTINCKGKDIEIDAIRLINSDIENILTDLPIKTVLKIEINKILFSDLSIRKKRIEIRKLHNKGLESKFMKLFLDLLEYIKQI